MTIFSIPVEFILFGLTLFCIALFSRYNLLIAVTGLVLIIAYRFFLHEYDFIGHFIGADGHGEWKILLNLFGLLTGFAILGAHFEESKLPDFLPSVLPNDWKGGFLLLIMIFILSAFLDNIAAALIGATVANKVYNGRVQVGFLAAIVAASNAGGAGSVLGDTTTTMMWIAGISAIDVLHAFIASGTAILFFGIIGSLRQQRYQPIIRDSAANIPISFPRIIVVACILAGAVITNIWIDFPAVGVWVVILVAGIFVSTRWIELRKAAAGSIFLICLVMAASLMPVNSLPAPTWHSTFVLGFVSAFFDNIPLTRLAIDQGGYDWGVLAYAVGFGGSMLWFGSSAGVAVAGKSEEAKSVITWLKEGWHIVVAYVLGFAVLLLTLGWNPHTS